MNLRHFPAHGKLQLSVRDQLLIIEGTGPANTEMVLKYQREVLAYRQQIMHKPWASLVLLRGQPLIPHAAKSLLADTIKQAKTMGLTATAVVFVDVQYAEMIRHFWQDIYADIGIEHRFFEDQQAAITWLHAKISQRQSKLTTSSK